MLRDQLISAHQMSLGSMLHIQHLSTFFVASKILKELVLPQQQKHFITKLAHGMELLPGIQDTGDMFVGLADYDKSVLCSHN